MFKCDDFIYVQIQKTACTHIVRLLSQLFDGEVIGKHNAATPEQLQSTPYFIASIRNPWDWYVSLWAFGIQGKGTLMHRLTARDLIAWSRRMFSDPKANHKDFLFALTKNVQQWRDMYAASNDNSAAFRHWLKAIHKPGNSRFLGEGYADTVLPEISGFMTHRYLELCCRHSEQLKKPTGSICFEQLSEFDARHCYIDSFVRQESLEATLCEALKPVRQLSGDEKALIFNLEKTNTSFRPLPVSAYYDQESIDLVQDRERLIIEKFNYLFPA